jgi:DNA-binding transcriptional regulator GbsR (MarR family)
MSTIEIKRDFIKFMEEKHSGLLFPKNFFGCMMAVFIEQEPITQDEIKRLTNYSKTTISQMLKLLQVNFPLIQIKKPKIRKKYYTINITTKEFMITFLKMLIEAYKDKVDFILPLIEEIKPYTKKHQKFQTFSEFLENYFKYSSLYINLLTDSAAEFSNLVKTEKIERDDLIKTDLKSSPKNQAYIQSLLNPPKLPTSVSNQQIGDKQLAKIYIQLKNKFYQKFRENLTSARSQTAIARAILGTELLLEKRPLTQEELERATDFQRSTISDTLKLLLSMKMVQLIKKPRDRKKYYMIVQSWDTRTINRLRLNIGYAIEMKRGISDFIEHLKRIDIGEDINPLLAFFQDIHHSYEQFEQYYKLLEVKYLNIRLKEYLELKNTN